MFERYIVDFYCSKAMLAIELDGSQHYSPEGIEYDEQRTRYLESLGIMVLRFSNADIRRNLRDVCQLIDTTVNKRCQMAQIQKGMGRKVYTTKRY